MASKNHRRGFISRHNIDTIIILCIILLSLWRIWEFTSRFTQSFPERVDVMNVAANTLLTLALLWVYMKMARDNSKQTRQMNHQTDSMSQQTEKMSHQLDSMEQQTESMRQQTEEMEKQAALQEEVAEIQKRQQRLMEAQYKPELVLQEVFEADDDTLILGVENKGPGLAKNIELDISFFVDRADKNTELVPIEDRIGEEIVEDDMRGEICMREGFTELSHALSQSSESETPRVDAGTVLPSGEAGQLETTVQLWHYSGWEAEPGEGRPIYFSRALNHLQDMGVEILSCRIDLIYQNILGEENDPQRLASSAVHLSDDPDLQDLIDDRHTTAIIEHTYAPLRGRMHAEFDMPRI